ncbi:MAG: TonB family protein [Bacteroidales bacterium]|nr:TonB family protein [Bacteroidales bacterium]
MIEFEEPEISKPRQSWNGARPQAERPDPSKDIKLVQSSEGQFEGSKSNEAPEATVDEFGDVDIHEPEREKPIDRRALFAAADNKTDKDTLAPQTAREPSDQLKAGHAAGNIKSGATSGEPNARLVGRTTIGALPKPAYNVQASGKVVVQIWVDQYGSVQKAVAGAQGTTVTDEKLWNAARAAALKAQFNMKADAPAMQEGTITYIFKLDK